MPAGSGSDRPASRGWVCSGSSARSATTFCCPTAWGSASRFPAGSARWSGWAAGRNGRDDMLIEDLIRLGRPVLESGLESREILKLITDVADDRVKNFYRHVLVVELPPQGADG